MAAFKFSCPICNRHLEYDQGWAGEEIDCPACNGRIGIPPLEMAGVGVQPSSEKVVPPMLPPRLGRVCVSEGVGTAERSSLALSSAPTESELRAFVGPNADYYIERWSLALVGNAQRPGVRFNWPAFFVPGCWLLYRKLYAAGGLFWAIALLLWIGSELLPTARVPAVFVFPMMYAFAGSANNLYLNKARKVVAEARTRRQSSHEHLATLARRGGTSLLSPFLFLLVFVLAVFLGSQVLESAGLSSPYGKRLTFGSIELYYMPPVAERQAQKFGQYLLKAQDFSERHATFQLLQTSGALQIRAVVKEGTEQDPLNVEAFKALGAEISKAVFEGSPVEVQLCDRSLKTLVSIPAGD